MEVACTAKRNFDRECKKTFATKSARSCREQVQQRKPALLDHLVGAGEQGRRHGEAEQFRRLQVDSELELGRLRHRQVGWPGALEDAACIDADLAIHVGGVSAVAHEPAGLDKLTHVIGRGKGMARRQRDELDASTKEESVRLNKEGLAALAHEACVGRINVATGAGFVRSEMQSKRTNS